MTSGMVSGLFVFDQEWFLRIRALLRSPLLEDYSDVFANLHAWAPFFVFLVILLYLSKPKSAAYSIFLCLGAFVLSYQAASILANYLMQPAPWKVEYWLTQAELPAFGNGSEISMPDWQIAVLAGPLHYARLRLKSLQASNISWAWLLVLVYCILRIYAGFTYPSGAVVAIMIGSVMGWLCYQLGRNLELIAGEEKGAAPLSSSDEATED